MTQTRLNSVFLTHIPGVPKVLRHVVFFKYLSRDQSYNRDSFFKRCVVKSSTKTIRRNSYWVVLMVSSIVKMNRSDEGPVSHGIKYILVLQIFRFEKMTTPGLFFKRWVMKNSTKTVRTNPYWLPQIVPPILKMNRSNDSFMSHRN